MHEAMMDGENPKLDELERLLNDPEVPMQPSRIWELAAEISEPARRSHSRKAARPL